MSADGAHLGISAGRALKTILGGESSPDENEQMDASTFATWIRSAPDVVDSHGEDGYTECGRVTAKWVLKLLEEQPESIKLGPWDLISATEKCFPESKVTIDELTGFLAGWAINAARRCVEMPAVENPAIVTMDSHP